MKLEPELRDAFMAETQAAHWPASQVMRELMRDFVQRQREANGLEWSYGWSELAAYRLRFLLDFGYATGLRASERVGAVLHDIRVDEHDDHWLNLVGKGGKPGRVALPPLARSAFDQYLVQRQLPATPQCWNPKTPILASLSEDEHAGITGARLWRVMRRFFLKAADVLQHDHPALAEKLRRASPHWMRHSHARRPRIRMPSVSCKVNE
ncbi:hypothetical protein DFQ28_011721 [Apophysomyces sp. BC1034]|nr:hypothetical protein DFQ28_011721 [Apophysomyces sp. BC1034]